MKKFNTLEELREDLMSEERTVVFENNVFKVCVDSIGIEITIGVRRSWMSWEKFAESYAKKIEFVNKSKILSESLKINEHDLTI